MRMSRNPGGVMFGGYQAALADPIAALACARVFPGYLRVDPRHDDFLRSRREFRPRDAVFSYAGTGSAIRIELEREGRSTPTFEYGYVRKDGCAARWFATRLRSAAWLQARDHATGFFRSRRLRTAHRNGFIRRSDAAAMIARKENA
jgi:hypothetical protein